jgi:hypothetical protein
VLLLNEFFFVVNAYFVIDYVRKRLDTPLRKSGKVLGEESTTYFKEVFHPTPGGIEGSREEPQSAGLPLESRPSTTYRCGAYHCANPLG